VEADESPEPVSVEPLPQPMIIVAAIAAVKRVAKSFFFIVFFLHRKNKVYSFLACWERCIHKAFCF
jgi:hypothetical protein